MKSLAVLFLTISFSLTIFGQIPRSTPRSSKNPTINKKAGNETEDFEKAIAIADTVERIIALQKFKEDYPNSKEKNRTLELITSGRAALADEKVRAGEKETGIELFRNAVREAPKPMSDKLYTEVILQIPNSLFFRGERTAANELARLIEEKADGNPKQTLALAAFYLGMENAAEAKRLTGKAIVLEPNLPAAYQTLGLAHRLDFQLEESANAYAKALELDSNSNVSRRNLAEMKRATGKSSEAVALYGEILARDDKDEAAKTGLILALFDNENKIEAENKLAKSLEANPNNLFLLVGAAYWYAAHEQGAQAIELAEKAVAVEPRYTWARIALARGLMQQKRPLEAEKSLLAARQYGDFPTLDYELAAARFQAGFYREAAEGLQKTFVVKGNSVITKLGGRVEKEAKNFTELLDAERRASIFQTASANNTETADKLKSLLFFSQNLENSADETLAASAADEFVKGEDQMKLHRQIFAADQLLQKRKALPKVLELTKASIGNVESGLNAPNAAAAILADELYFSRRLAITRNELIVVPNVPRQTLSNILRGRIEDITGWALFQDNKQPEAVIRLKRAVSVLPEKSSWWRNSMWRLGTAQENVGNSKEAIDAYIQSYTNGDKDPIRYGIIETVYQKVNGNLDGLELKIGAKPALTASNYSIPPEVKTTEQSTALRLPSPEIKIEAVTQIKPEVVPTPTISETPAPVEQPQPISQISNAETPVKTEPAPTPELKPEPTPDEKSAEVDQTETVSEDTAVSKVIFEPIVITVPKIQAVVKPSPETKSEEKPFETETPKTESKTSEPISEKQPAETSANTRPRVIIEDQVQTIVPCKITVSQETISIVKNGGNLSLLLNIDGEATAKDLKATSSSSADLEVLIEPGIDGQTNGAIFVVKSISPKIGVYTVKFELPCGKKEVVVKVR